MLSIRSNLLFVTGLVLLAAMAFSKETTTMMVDDNTTEAMNMTNTTEETIKPPIGSGFKIYTQAVGRSGKIKLSTDESFDSNKTVFIQMDSLVERGNVTQGGTTQMNDVRSFKTFANQEFMFSSVNENDVYPDTDIPVMSFNFSTSLMEQGKTAEIGTLTLNVYIFKEKANLTVDNETITIAPGNVKFNIQIENYMFCKEPDCNGNGQLLIAKVEVKSQGGAKVEKTNKKAGDNVDAFTLGGDSTIRVSNKVNLDGNWTDLPTPPKFETQGPKTSLVLEIPMFEDKAIYDPTIELEGAFIDDTSTTATTATTTKKSTEVEGNSACSQRLDVMLGICSLMVLKFLYW